jgi:hypothetical protein
MTYHSTNEDIADWCMENQGENKNQVACSINKYLGGKYES